jgi:hypothetical protein
MTKRIQRSRKVGWRKPDNCVCVTRPGHFGNPFVTAASFEVWLRTGNVAGHDLIPGVDPESLGRRRTRLVSRLDELIGQDVACYCPTDAACHGDVLLVMARELSEKSNAGTDNQPAVCTPDRDATE